MNYILSCQTCKYKIQIHEYSLYTNTAHDEMAVIPIKCYIFENPLMQGCYKLYFELLNMQIQNTNTQIQRIYKYSEL